MNPFKLDGIGPTSYERHDFGWELLMPSERDRPNSQENTQRPKRNRLHGPAHGANLMLVPNCIGRPQRRQRRGARLLRFHWPSDRVRGGVNFGFADFGAPILSPPPLHPSLAIIIHCDALDSALCNAGHIALPRVHFPTGARARRRRALCARAISLSRMRDLRACASSVTRRPPVLSTHQTHQTFMS